MTLEFIVETLEETQTAGVEIARALSIPSCVYLHGAMGTGKTTLTKAILRSLGYDKAVTSPTYNLIQEYRVPTATVYHMDLYRLADPEEIEYLALPDLWASNSLFLIEWPQKGEGFLPQADVSLSLNTFNDSGIEKRKIVLAK